MWKLLPEKIQQGDIMALSRAISLVENEAEGYEDFLRRLDFGRSPKITGVTGPPGAGKSTLVDCLIGEYIQRNERVCVLCIDPSSAYTGGALLGDRIRMREWYNHPGVFIRSLSTRGMLGGLNAGIVEITDVVRTFPCDHLIIETVGVGQSEIGIAGLADTTVVVQVPEGGDDIQAMKAGLMEIADVFVVNKCDRPGADIFVKNLQAMLREHEKQTPVIRTTASSREGIALLADAIRGHEKRGAGDELSILLKRAIQLILKNKMKQVDTMKLEKLLKTHCHEAGFNMYKLISAF